MAPRLSVVVPFFNVERYVIPCLESLQRQTFSDFEVVLINDGSTDATHDLATAFCKVDSRFRIVRQENQGLGPARNTGVSETHGELLAFVDSDDLVPLRAYEQMVRSLDDSGSDFVAGDARRFNALGVRDSYVHQVPFAARRIATHAFEVPVLALDRMVWNKMYRRRFWDDNDFLFPAMLYEDYPVTIKSHVRAKSVDVLSDPVYYWRERDGGELSITQRKWELQNLRERVRSAELVLDFLEQEAPQLRETVQRHLLSIDVSAIVAALHENEESQYPEIVDLATHLSRRMLPSVLKGASPFERVQNHLLAERRINDLKTLVGYRAKRGITANVVRVGHLRPKYYFDLPFFGDESKGVPRERYRIGSGAFDLRATVEDLHWEDGLLHVDLSAYINHLPMTKSSRVTAWLENKGGKKVGPLTLTRSPHQRAHLGADLSGAHLAIDPLSLESTGFPGSGFWRLMVKVKCDGVTRQGSVRHVSAGRGRWATYHRLTAEKWAQPQVLKDGRFGLWIRGCAYVVEDCRAVEGEIVVTGSIKKPTQAETVVLRLRTGEATFREFSADINQGSDGSRFTARVVGLDLIGHGNHDDPVEERVIWIPRLVVEGKDVVLAVAPDCEEAVITAGTRVVMATRTAHGNLSFVESYAHPMITVADWVDDGLLHLKGIHSVTGTFPSEVVLRRFVTPGQPVEHRVPVLFDGGQFSFELDVPAIIRAAAQALAEAEDEGRMPSPWHVLFPFDRGDVAGVMARSTAWRTAGPRVVCGREVRLTVGRGDVVRLVVGSVMS